MKNVVITGANRGIGVELAKMYAKGSKVFALCRKRSDELDQLNDINIIEGVELKEESALKKALDQCPKKIDLLVNNAGIFYRDCSQMGMIKEQSVQDEFLVNSLAPLMLIQAALDRLEKGSKIALISSRMGSIEDNQSGGFYGYRMSKAALNAMGKSLAIDLKPRGVAVTMLHPGMVKTNMTGYQGQYTPQEAARGLLERIEELTLDNTGQFIHAQGEKLSW